MHYFSPTRYSFLYTEVTANENKFSKHNKGGPIAPVPSILADELLYEENKLITVAYTKKTLVLVEYFPALNDLLWRNSLYKETLKLFDSLLKEGFKLFAVVNIEGAYQLKAIESKQDLYPLLSQLTYASPELIQNLPKGPITYLDHVALNRLLNDTVYPCITPAKYFAQDPRNLQSQQVHLKLAQLFERYKGEKISLDLSSCSEQEIVQLKKLLKQVQIGTLTLKAQASFDHLDELFAGLNLTPVEVLNLQSDFSNESLSLQFCQKYFSHTKINFSCKFQNVPQETLPLMLHLRLSSTEFLSISEKCFPYHLEKLALDVNSSDDASLFETLARLTHLQQLAWASRFQKLPPNPCSLSLSVTSLSVKSCTLTALYQFLMYFPHLKKLEIDGVTENVATCLPPPILMQLEELVLSRSSARTFELLTHTRNLLSLEIYEVPENLFPFKLDFPKLHSLSLVNSPDIRNSIALIKAAPRLKNLVLVEESSDSDDYIQVDIFRDFTQTELTAFTTIISQLQTCHLDFFGATQQVIANFIELFMPHIGGDCRLEAYDIELTLRYHARELCLRALTSESCFDFLSESDWPNLQQLSLVMDKDYEMLNERIHFEQTFTIRYLFIEIAYTPQLKQYVILLEEIILLLPCLPKLECFYLETGDNLLKGDNRGELRAFAERYPHYFYRNGKQKNNSAIGIMMHNPHTFKVLLEELKDAFAASIAPSGNQGLPSVFPSSFSCSDLRKILNTTQTPTSQVKEFFPGHYVGSYRLQASELHFDTETVRLKSDSSGLVSFELPSHPHLETTLKGYFDFPGDGQWHSLPSLTPWDKLVAVKPSSSCPLEWRYDNKFHFYQVKGDAPNNASLFITFYITIPEDKPPYPPTTPISLTPDSIKALLSNPHLRSKWMALPFEKRLASLRQFFSSFDGERQNTFSQEQGNNMGALFMTVIENRRGNCRIRAFCFLWLAPKLLPDAQSYSVGNHCHNFAEVHFSGLIYRCNLGGSSAHLKFRPLPIPPETQHPAAPIAFPRLSETNTFAKLYHWKPLAAETIGLSLLKVLDSQKTCLVSCANSHQALRLYHACLLTTLSRQQPCGLIANLSQWSPHEAQINAQGKLIRVLDSVGKILQKPEGVVFI